MIINNIEYEIGIYDLEGNFIDSTDNWDVLEKTFKISPTEVKNYLVQNYNKIKHYQLIFKDLNKNSSRLPFKTGDVTKLNTNHRSFVPVAKYYNNKLITSYKSTAEASKLTGLDGGNISQSCNKGCKVGIFNFKYIQ